MAPFINDFCKVVTEPTVMSSYLSYLFERKKYERFCFVEGNIDVKFYSSFLYKKINISKEMIKFINCGNKTHVIETLEYFSNEVKKDLFKTYFIVDRDYDNISKYIKKENLMNKLSFTKYYSIENYMFEPENLQIILEYLKLQECEKEIFKTEFQNNIEKILPYETLLYMQIHDSKKNINMFFGNTFKEQGIDNHFEFIINKLGINEFNNFTKKNKYLRENILQIRGHELENIFNNIMENFGINLKLSNLLKNEDLIRRLNIEIVIK